MNWYRHPTWYHCIACEDESGRGETTHDKLPTNLFLVKTGCFPVLFFPFYFRVCRRSYFQSCFFFFFFIHFFSSFTYGLLSLPYVFVFF